MVMYNQKQWPDDDINKMLAVISDAFGVSVAAIPAGVQPIPLDVWFERLEKAYVAVWGGKSD